MTVQIKKSNIGSMLAQPVVPTAYAKHIEAMRVQNFWIGNTVTLQPLFTSDGWLKRFGKIQYEILDIKKTNFLDEVKVRKLWTKARGTTKKHYDQIANIVYDDSLCNGSHNIQKIDNTDSCITCGFCPYIHLQNNYPNIIW
jgi:hypothetical protein